MAKFALPMKDGIAVSTMAELREHFDLKEAIRYLGNGRLMKWLRDRADYNEEADKLDTLIDECKGNHLELAKRLCAILGVEFDETKFNAEELEGLIELSQKAEKLGQYTSDNAILTSADRCAFNQEDLDKLAKDDKPEIYLCNGEFKIPLEADGKHYYGFGNAVAIIPSDEYVDFEDLQITFDKKYRVKFDEAYERIDQENNYMKKASESLNALDYEKGIEFLTKSAEMGNAKAMLELGKLYYQGEGVAKDFYEAAQWVQRAIDNHSQEAVEELFKLGVDLEEGNGVRQNFVKAKECYQKAADAGNVDAMFRLGKLYQNGGGTIQDDVMAREYYMKAVDAGNEKAMNNAGIMFQEGLGGEKDMKMAKTLYERAANKGLVLAMRNLANCYYYNGEYTEAKPWYEKAAAEEDGFSAYQLFKMYEAGQGVPEDKEFADMWKKKAAKFGYTGEGFSTATKVLAGAAAVGALAVAPVATAALGIGGALYHFFGSSDDKK